MEVHFSPEQEAQLWQITRHTGTAAEQVVKEAALRLVEETSRFLTAVREGLAEADRGQLVDDDQVAAPASF